MLEYERTKKIIGDEGVEKLNKSSVLIVGIGGVGGSSLEMLSRSGILNIAIMDYDTFEESNLNRQVLSLNNNIGKYKVDVAEKRIKLINKGELIKVHLC